MKVRLTKNYRFRQLRLNENILIRKGDIVDIDNINLVKYHLMINNLEIVKEEEKPKKEEEKPKKKEEKPKKKEEKPKKKSKKKSTRGKKKSSKSKIKSMFGL